MIHSAVPGKFATVGAAMALLLPGAAAQAKSPGQTYCFHGVCHRVLTLEETNRVVGRSETVIASFYDHPTRDKGNPNAATSSGERFDGNSDRTAASPIYPNGTRLLLWNAKTKAAAEVRVTNSGPYHGARRLDVSRGAAERLGFRPVGVSQLNVTILSAPTPQEARYVKGRTYTPAAGYLGVFESAAAAHAAASGGAKGQAGGSAGPAAIAAASTPKAIHTGSVGWDKTVKPVRPPLQRPASIEAQRSVAGARPGQATSGQEMGGQAASKPTSGWTATAIEKSEPTPSRAPWPAAIQPPAVQPPAVLTLRPNGAP